ncbi:MAG: hypothetical protein PVJ43_09705 [Gemmatimonadales bacterium]
MKKVLLFFIVIGAMALFDPRIREGILGLSPTLSAANKQRSAERALTQIALVVQEDAGTAGTYPLPAGFADWLERTRRPRLDPWGTAYYLELYPDSFVVGSPGPDARRRTGDDLRVAKLRGPDAERLRPGYSSPAPPASGVKASAIRNAQRAAGRGRN